MKNEIQERDDHTKDCNDRFEIGGEDLLASAAALVATESKKTTDQTLPQDVIDDIRVRIGTLLKTETVSFLLGAGASVDCGGQLIGTVPVAVEKALCDEGINSNNVSKWLEIFYLAVRYLSGGNTTPITPKEILDRHTSINKENSTSLNVNFEQVLAMLHRWRSALPATGGRLRMDGSPPRDVKSDDLDACISYATRALAQTCNLPAEDKKDGLDIYKTFIRKILTRPLNLKRVNIFTLNYDTLVEQAADTEGVVLLDGFIGTHRRVFRPESYEQDLYFPAETTEGRVHRFDRVLHLYKLHGSISWRASDSNIDNPYGVESAPFDSQISQALLIYPTPAKYGETLGMPYSEMFRRFATAVVRPQSVLFVIGYGFGDEHVNAIIRQALAIPSFTLVIVDPNPKSEFVNILRCQKDRRIWLAEGLNLGTFAGFVELILPDLKDEEIRKKVLKTHRALSKNSHEIGENSDDN
jgi:hypothetical protein